MITIRAQQIAFVDTETGELKEQRLVHREGAEEFYRALAATGQRVCVGMEASGHARWFERVLAELKIELKVGDASEIQPKRGRKQKTGSRGITLSFQSRGKNVLDIPSYRSGVITL